jgi:putative DNA primase/helicase
MALAALKVSAGGWPVFPCDPGSKRPLTSRGFKDASRDPHAIRSSWKRHPNAMIGVPTGRAIGAFVVDIDAGVETSTGEIVDACHVLAALQRELGSNLPPTWTATTPRGGMHLYFAAPPSGCPRNRTGLIRHVDVRGEGGYVIVPPSRREDGQAYTWATDRDAAPLAAAPPALLHLLSRRSLGHAAHENRSTPHHRQGGAASPKGARPYALAALEREVRRTASAVRGTRNQVLNQAAFSLGQLVAVGEIAESEVIEALEAAADRCCLIEDDGRKAVQRTIRSGLSAGIQNPRPLSTRPPRRTEKGGRRPAGSKGEGAVDRKLAHIDMTDLGNAKRFVERNRGRFLKCNDMWLWWNGQKWTAEGAEAAVMRAVHQTVEAIQQEADAVLGTDDDYKS